MLYVWLFTDITDTDTMIYYCHKRYEGKILLVRIYLFIFFIYFFNALDHLPHKLRDPCTDAEYRPYSELSGQYAHIK